MRTLFFLIAISSILVFNACTWCKKNKSAGTGATVNDTKTNTAQTTQGKAAADGPAYDLVVSFLSIGAGTDSKAKQQLKEFIVGFQADKNVTLKYEDFAWGREGEEDYCFALDNLSAELKQKFVLHVKDMYVQNQLVRVGENEQFLHRRK